MVAANRASIASRSVLCAMNIRLGVPRTFATTALAITMLLATFSPHASTINSADAAEAGIDGEHIYAGISYESDPSLDRCEWVLPETVHQLGVRAGLTIRYWNGISWTLYNCERGGESRLVWLPDISVETAAESTRDVVRDRVPQLLHNFSPAPHKGIVKTPTWFWVHPALWRPVSVTARVPTPRAARLPNSSRKACRPGPRPADAGAEGQARGASCQRQRSSRRPAR